MFRGSRYNLYEAFGQRSRHGSLAIESASEQVRLGLLGRQVEVDRGKNFCRMWNSESRRRKLLSFLRSQHQSDSTGAFRAVASSAGKDEELDIGSVLADGMAAANRALDSCIQECFYGHRIHACLDRARVFANGVGWWFWM